MKRLYTLIDSCDPSKTGWKQVNVNILNAINALGKDGKGLATVANYLLGSVYKDRFYSKGVPSDIWSEKPVFSKHITELCSNSNNKAITCYYGTRIKKLIDNHVFHEFRCRHVRLEGGMVRFFCDEPNILQWNVWNENKDSPVKIYPATVIRLINSYNEICKKILNIVSKVDDRINIDTIKYRFATFIFNQYILKTSLNISRSIKPLINIKDFLTIDKYFEYVVSQLKNFHPYDGIDEGCLTKIVDNEGVVKNILTNKKMNIYINETNVKTSPTDETNDNSDIFFASKPNSKPSSDYVCYLEESASCVMKINDLQKSSFSPLDRSYNKEILFNKNISSNSIIEDNKEEVIRGSKETNIPPLENTRIRDDNGIKKDNEKMVVEMKKIHTNIFDEDITVKPDIIPKDPSIRNPRGRPRKAINRAPVNFGFPYVRKDPPTKNGASFFKKFRHVIRTRFKDVAFVDNNDSWRNECTIGNEIMDKILTKVNCLKDNIVEEWFEWYVNVFLTEKKVNSGKFFLSLKSLKGTWDAFDKVRRKDVLPNKSNMTSNLFDKLSSIFENDLIITAEKTLKAMEIFGVVIVSNYLLFKGNDRKDIEILIRKAFDIVYKMPNRNVVITEIFDATCKYICDCVNNKKVFLYDWEEKYKMIWGVVECSTEFYRSRKVIIESRKQIAEDFFLTIHL